MDFELVITDNAVAQINGAIAGLSAITTVEDDRQARKADAAIKTAKTIVKIIHDERMAITRRIDAAKKAVMAREAEVCADLNEHLKRVQLLCGDYVTKREAEKAQANAVAEVMGEQVNNSKAVAGVGARQYWGFRIVDPMAVPRAYCMPDEVTIRAYLDGARRNGAKIESLHIDGVEFYAEYHV